MRLRGCRLTLVRGQRWILALVGLTGLVAAALLVIVGFDDGAFNGPMQQLLSARLGRTVGFDRLRAQLLSARPELTIDGLRIANPAWAGPQPLLSAASVRVEARWPLILSPLRVTIAQPVLHLVRQGPGKDNWSIGKRPAAGSAMRLRVAGGRFDLADQVRQLSLGGVFSYDAGANPGFPLALTAAGVLKGAPVSLSVRGAPFGAAPKGRYGFQLDLLDADTHAQLQGVSAGPFDLETFDFNVQASGPNLADLGYLFGLFAPNSSAFRLAARAQRDASRFRLSKIRAVIGRSPLAGDVSSIGTSGSRQVRLNLTSPDLWREDLQPLFAPRPPHAIARSQSGLPRHPSKSGVGLLSDAPFPTEALRGVDLQVVVRAERLDGFAAPITNANLHLDLQRGRLSISPVTFDLSPGQVRVSMLLDASGPLPQLQLTGRLRQVRLGDMSRHLAHTLDGALDVWFSFRGRGVSIHRMALEAVGRIGLRLTDGVFMKSKAAALSGDLMQAVNLSLGDKGARTPLRCAVAEFDASKGVLRSDKLVVVTGAGSAIGRGSIDLGAERLAISFQGQPTRHRLLQLNVPVLLDGPITRPVAKLQTAQALKQAGAAGVLALAASPLAAVLPLVGHAAAQPDCAALTADVATYVR